MNNFVHGLCIYIWYTNKMIVSSKPERIAGLPFHIEKVGFCIQSLNKKHEHHSSLTADSEQCLFVGFPQVNFIRVVPKWIWAILFFSTPNFAGNFNMRFMPMMVFYCMLVFLLLCQGFLRITWNKTMPSNKTFEPTYIERVALKSLKES